MSEILSYEKAGVDTHKAAHILAKFSRFMKGRTPNKNVLSAVGPFAACYDLGPLLKELEHPILVSACDGVGTKSLLAMQWGQMDGLGQDLVAMNVNDILCTGAQPLAFLDYYATSHLDENQVLPILKSIQLACEQAGCALVGGETAEMPGLYQPSDFDLAGFCVGLVDKKNRLHPEKVQVGDTILGLGSTGVHSTGFSLVRKILEREKVSPSETTPFGNESWKDTLLKPTRIYTKALSPFLTQIHGLAHITGGGLYENLPRALPPGVSAHIQLDAWPRLALFEWLQEKTGLSFEQMLSTFNTGIGMIVICNPKEAGTIKTQLAKETGCWELGTIERGQASEPAPIVCT